MIWILLIQIAVTSSMFVGVSGSIPGPNYDKLNKTKDWALVQNAASAGGVKVELGLFR